MNIRNRAFAGIVGITFIGLAGAVWLHNRSPDDIRGVTTEEVVQTALGLLRVELERFRRDTGRYPTTTEGLAALAVAPAIPISNWRGPYLKEWPLNDPWGNEYYYRRDLSQNDRPFELYSLGKDGVPSTDDIALGHDENGATPSRQTR